MGKKFGIDYLIIKERLKGQMQCFSMQVVMIKCFLLNPEKIFALTSFLKLRGKYKMEIAKFMAKS